MKTSNLCFHALSLSIIAALLAGCGGSQSAAPQLPAASGPVGSAQNTRSSVLYQLEDLGTLGGPQSVVVFGNPTINQRGTVAGCADTSASDSDYPNLNPFLPAPVFPDPYIFHTFAWQDGRLTDLKALPGSNSSCENWISGNGLIVGASENGLVDPLTGWPAMEGVLWKAGDLINLGTFGGNESFAISVNNSGEVIGAAANTVPDPYSVFFGWGTQTRAFLWADGKKRDLGTLGGPDALATQINEPGQIFGASYLSNIPNKITGIPPYDAFLWEGDRMRDIHNAFGGAQTNPFSANNRGQLVGNASDKGEAHLLGFIWEKGAFKRLGTLGGTFSEGVLINDAGVVAGNSTLPGDATAHAFIWKHGVISDLGVLSGDTCANAEGLNSKGQVVGFSEPNCSTFGRAVLWANGKIIDLNAQIRGKSDLYLQSALGINDRGEITGTGVLSNGDIHAFLLIPCADPRRHTMGCNERHVAQNASEYDRQLITRSQKPQIQSNQVPLTRLSAIRVRLAYRLRLLRLNSALHTQF